MDTQYFTGKPCKRGHIAPRLKSTRACLECCRAVNDAWRKANPEKIRRAVRSWRRANPELVRAQRDRRPRWDMAVRNAIRDSLSGRKAGRSWELLVGYSRESLRLHLERQFSPGMTWENYGEWHIDHIVPKSSFSERELQACWALSNLRPLWAVDNQRKYNKRLYLI